MKIGSLCLMPIAALLLAGCPLPPYGDSPGQCGWPGCHGDDDDRCDDDDDDYPGGSGGYGGTGGYAGTAGKAGSGGGGHTPPRSHIGLDEYLHLLRLDAASVPRFEQRELTYVDFHAAYNNDRYSDAELAAFANATLKLLNNLDVHATVAGAQGAAVVTDGEGRPLAVRFNALRFNLDKQRDIVDTVVRLDNRQDVNNPFPCDIPAIPGVDFLHIAATDDMFNVFGDNGQGTFESAYSNIALRRLLVDAGLLAEDQLVFEPITTSQFIANGFVNISPNADVFGALEAVDPVGFNRAALDVLYNNAQDQGRLVRGCFLNSNVSAANRCVDRLTQSVPYGGATYLSLDVLSANSGNPNKDIFAARFIGPGNPPADPLVRPVDGQQPFTIDVGQAIYQQKNSMLGFLSYNANFELLSNSMGYALYNDGNGVVPPGLSADTCGYCHSSFTIPFADQMLPTILQSPIDFAYAIRLAQSQDEWDATFDIDAVNYDSALRNVYPYIDYDDDRHLPDGIWSLGKQYMNDLSIEDVLAELGLVNEEVFFDALDQLAELGADVEDFYDGYVSRDTFTVNYQLLVEQVAASNADFLRGCVAREAVDVGDFPDEDPFGDGRNR